jgi:anti-anti-sigma factor
LIVPQPPARHLRTAITEGVLVVTITDSELRGDTLADTLRQELVTAVTESGADKVVLDFGNVQRLSSSTALRPLLSLRHRLQDTGGRMVLCNLRPLVEEMFGVLRLISTSSSQPAPFDVQPDVRSAIAFLKKHKPEGKKS